MAKKISIINMKGGVGKTTLTIQLAWYFAGFRHWSKNVLVIDLDPQFNTSQILLRQENYKTIIDENRPTVWEIFEQNIPTPTGTKTFTDPHEPIYTARSFSSGTRIDLIPSRLELANTLKRPGQNERKLASHIGKIEHEYDLILIDCAPTESILTTAAYFSSDYLLVPVKPEYLCTIGLPLLAKSMSSFQEDESKSLELAGVVFNGSRNSSSEEQKSKRDVRAEATKHNWYVFDAEIPYSDSLPKGARAGLSLDRTKYARRWKKRQVQDFAEEFAQRINL